MFDKEESSEQINSPRDVKAKWIDFVTRQKDEHHYFIVDFSEDFFFSRKKHLEKLSLAKSMHIWN